MSNVLGSMRIRACSTADHDAIVALSLRAWAPVFESVDGVLGEALSKLLHGDDWRVHQAGEVRETLADASQSVWVAEVAEQVVGFAAARAVDRPRLIGEITMLAVDPAAQRRGVGKALTDRAAKWLCDQGMRVAIVETGGEAGHAPARRVYEQAGFRVLPIARYFRELPPS
jgi:ribosomal protein S18 acetylase RimI-like enzyme